MNSTIKYIPEVLKSFSPSPAGCENYINVSFADAANNYLSSFTLSEEMLTHFNNNYVIVPKAKQDYYIKGIANLLKSKKLLELTLQLSQGLISETEYEQEIESNPDEYIIQVNPLHSIDDILILKDIVKELGKKFNTDEITEIFSVSFANVDQMLNA